MHVQLEQHDWRLEGRQCEGLIFNRTLNKLQRCFTILTYERNFNNVFCWNCLLEMAKRKGNKEVIKHIQETYL